MPELPEVETIARQLNAVLPGKTIQEVDVRREKSFLSFATASGGQEISLIGKTIKSVSRKAKNIIVTFEKWDGVLLVHLKMTGQLVWRGKHKGAVFGGHPTPDWVSLLPSNHTRIVCHFTDGSVLYFNDMRVFGWWKVLENSKFKMHMSKLPPDVIDPEFTPEYLIKALKSSGRAVKLVLLDQAKIGGLGNIYVNDALWLAGTKPTRSSRDLTVVEVKRIYNACVQVIKRGIETGGASESTYKHINGLGGKYQEEFLAYKREGEICGWKGATLGFKSDGCGGIIEKMQLGGRGTYWCPVHQK